jgi:hypothetical protein
MLSKDQPDMMAAMMNYNPVAISLFTISWTIGMAAMMFPAITSMVLLYIRLIKRSNSGSDGYDDTIGKGMASSQYSIFVERGGDDACKTTKKPKRSSLSSLSFFTSSVSIIFFVGSYLLVWAVTGIVLPANSCNHSWSKRGIELGPLPRALRS